MTVGLDRRLVLLGSTGSIGTQTLSVLERFPNLARLHGLAAGGSRPQLVAEQVVHHRPERVAIFNEQAADTVEQAITQACRAAGIPAPQLIAGQDAVVELAGSLGPGDAVLNGITGSVGLLPTLAALASGARLALANKESLVVGGQLVTDAAPMARSFPWTPSTPRSRKPSRASGTIRSTTS